MQVSLRKFSGRDLHEHNCTRTLARERKPFLRRQMGTKPALRKSHYLQGSAWSMCEKHGACAEKFAQSTCVEKRAMKIARGSVLAQVCSCKSVCANLRRVFSRAICFASALDVCSRVSCYARALVRPAVPVLSCILLRDKAIGFAGATLCNAFGKRDTLLGGAPD